MKIVFFGSDDFAWGHLKRLFSGPHKIVGCVTQPDRRKGRGMKMVLSPIKEFAYANDIFCFQPEDINDPFFVEGLKALHADLFVVIAYGRILPRNILEIPVKGAVNVHGSLLPKYRGAAPINWAIIDGEAKTGLSVIAMNEKMDAGDILGAKEVMIAPDDTSVSLRQKMMEVGPDLLDEVLELICDNMVVRRPQIEVQATVASKMTKELGLIDWQKSAVGLHNLIKGLLPWPCAYTFFKGKQLKVLSSEVVDGQDDEVEPGAVIAIGREGITLAAGEGLLLIKEVQPESSRRMSAHEFANGQRIEKGFVFTK